MTGRREVFDQAMRLGHSAAWDHQWDRAITAYGQALEEFPDDASALTSMGFALLQIDRLEDALRCYQRAASLNPGDPIAPEKCGEIFERLGRLNEAAQTYLAVAEVHLKRRDVHKAIANWSRAVRLTPDNLAAHSRLALASERIGQTRRAVLEYIEVARIFQRARDMEKALAAANRALQLDPQSAEARDALDRLRRGVPLPVLEQPAPLSDPLGPAELPPLDAGAEAGSNGREGSRLSGKPADSPLAAAQAAALGLLAELLFEEDTEVAAGTGALSRATGRLAGDQARRAQAARWLGQAITSHTSGDLKAALSQYEKAQSNGLDNPVVNFVVGSLYLDQNRRTDAIRLLKRAAAHETVGLGALFGLGLAEHQAGHDLQACNHLLEALKRLDQELVEPDRREQLEEAYEGLAERFEDASSQDVASVVTGLLDFLSGAGWEERVRQARRQLDRASLDGQVAPLADLLAMPGASQVIDSLRQIDGYINQGLLATAMEEAYFVLTHSPTHLPVHVRMAEILVAENKIQAAIDKYTAVAETYRIRGELTRAARVTQQVLKLSPLDVSMRSWLIEILVEQSKFADALRQFVDMAETYYQLADLEGARNAYADALLLARQHNLGRDWQVQLLHRMGDIDLQRLNWREAQGVYEQIKNLAPDDHSARATLIDLLYRLGNAGQALAEIDAYLRQLMAANNTALAIGLLEELLENQPDDVGLISRLARLYQEAGRREDAIAQYDRLGELQLEAGLTAQAADTIRAILALEPDEPEAYRQLLEEIQR